MNIREEKSIVWDRSWDYDKVQVGSVNLKPLIRRDLNLRFYLHLNVLFKYNAFSWIFI